VESKAVSEIAHDVLPVRPETDDDSGTAVAENPDCDGGFGGELAGVPDEVDGGGGADGTGRSEHKTSARE
jgi:hypothetical protein